MVEISNEEYANLLKCKDAFNRLNQMLVPKVLPEEPPKTPQIEVSKQYCVIKFDEDGYISKIEERFDTPEEAYQWLNQPYETRYTTATGEFTVMTVFTRCLTYTESEQN